MRKVSKLELQQEKLQRYINKTNDKIQILGVHTSSLYTALTDIQSIFDKIRNVPTEKKLKYEKIKRVRLNWKQQVEKIERDYQKVSVKNAGAAVAGAGMGVAVAAMGPTVAMGVATTFGVASTGTAISALSGAAATNAALAWLGGGALAAGGGGMAAGNAFLAMAGPVGWTIAGVALLTSGLFFWKNKSEKECLEDIFTLIGERDEKRYSLAIVELNERISKIDDENDKLKAAIEKIISFGLDYNEMSEAQQYELGAYVNLMHSSTQLLVNPIKGLQPNFKDEDYEEFLSSKAELKQDLRFKNKTLIISLANLLYKIDLDEKKKKLFWKSLKRNSNFLKSMGISKKEFDYDIINGVFEALEYRYT